MINNYKAKYYFGATWILLYLQKWKYLFSFYNFIVWVLVGTTLTFIVTSSAEMKDRCLLTWRSGWIAMFLAWINFIMYLRRCAFIYKLFYVQVVFFCNF